MVASINIGAPVGPQHSPSAAGSINHLAPPAGRGRKPRAMRVPGEGPASTREASGMQARQCPSPRPSPRERGEEGEADRLKRAIGLMSGTSLDGIDVAFIETDGRNRVTSGPAMTLPYPREFRERLRSMLGGAGPVG